VSGATYRIEVKPTGGVYYKYGADIRRISDDALIARELGDTPDEAADKARVLVARMNEPATFEGVLYVDDAGQDAEHPGHSVKVTE